MFGRIAVIALNTYRESVRARVLIGLAGVAFAIALYAMVVGSFTLQSAPRVVADLGAASISLFSIAVAIVIGATSLHRELEQKTLFPILARPISRTEYLLGKYLGTLLTILVFILADTGLVLMLGALLGEGGAVPPLAGTLTSIAIYMVVSLRKPQVWTYGAIAWSVVFFGLGVAFSGTSPEDRRVVLASSALAFLEVGIIAAIATLFSSFSTPFLSALFTIGLFIVGRSADDLSKLPVKQFGQRLHDAGVVLSKIVPNLQIFVPPRPLLAGETVDASLASYLGFAVVTAIAWSIGLLATASLVFRRRDFL